MLTEEKKNRDQLIKDSENITKKTKVILAGLKSAEADLEAFQVRVCLSAGTVKGCLVWGV